MSIDPFVADGYGWNPVNQRLATGRRIVAVSLTAVLSVVAVGPLTVGGYTVLGFAAFLLGLAVGLWLWWLIGRQVRAIGYAERNDYLLVVSGISRMIEFFITSGTSGVS